jgi:pimeloyl-ACP methyl ester carboxylesterase
MLVLPPNAPPTAKVSLHPDLAPGWVVPDNGSLVTYNSSVDGFPLSYEEWVPAGSAGTGMHHHLLVYLHGQQDTSGNWFPGGLPSSFVTYLNATVATADVNVARAIVANASLNHVLLIAVNSRSGAGFFVNSPCGGPQEQDVLDAIAHEESIRSVNPLQVYLVGPSMGATGVLSLAGNHPGMFAGVASIASGPDMFEGLAWRQFEATQPTHTPWANGSINGLSQLECGVLPSPTANATVIGLYTYLSVARFMPQTLAHVRVYVTGAGLDMRVPNNGSIWNYMQVNNSWVNSSCVVATADGEPANCTTTFATLHAQHPNLFLYRYVYEARGVHGLGQLSAADMFAFWRGTVPTGDYVSSYPPNVISPAP